MPVLQFAAQVRHKEIEYVLLSGDFGNENLIVSFFLVQRYESRSSCIRQNLQDHSVSEVLA